MSKNEPREIRALTGFRLPVTLGVLFLHANVDVMQPLNGGGRVPLFFILSGFVIAAAYMPENVTRINWRDFCIKRFARLYPVLIFSSLLLAPWWWNVILDSYHGGVVGPAFARTTLFGGLQTFFPPVSFICLDAMIPNGFAWFVLVELSAGLLVPLFAKPLWSSPPWLTGCYFLLLPVLAAFWVLWGGMIPSIPNYWIGHFQFAGSPLGWLPLILFGCVSYRVATWVKTSPKLTRAAVMASFPLAALTIWHFFLGLPWASGGIGTFLIFLQLGFTLIVLAPDQGLAAKLLGSRPMLYLGKRCYSIYLMSRPVLLLFIPWLAEKLNLPTPSADSGSLTAFVLVAICGIVGIATFELVERPCKDLIRKMFLSQPRQDKCNERHLELTSTAASGSKSLT